MINNEEKIIYRLDDEISFRKCSLYRGTSTSHGNCTNFGTEGRNWTQYYRCNQEGIHFHCSKHPEIELEDYTDSGIFKSCLICPKCKKTIDIGSYNNIISRCLRALNRDEFKDAKLVRLDDWYIPELKEKEKPTPEYHLTTNIKTDKDGDTIVVLYVSYVGNKDKVQYFIKPEKLQLTSDHKDMDPGKIISRIEVKLKDRTLTHVYDDDNE